MNLSDFFLFIGICVFVTNILIFIIGLFAYIFRCMRLCDSAIDWVTRLCLIWMLCALFYCFSIALNKRNEINQQQGLEMKLTITGFDEKDRQYCNFTVSIDIKRVEKPFQFYQRLENFRNLRKFAYCYFEQMEYGEPIDYGYHFIHAKSETEQIIT